MRKGGKSREIKAYRLLCPIRSQCCTNYNAPTGALDSKTSREVLNFLKQLNKEGNTIVMITHDNSIAMEAKRVVRIADGHKIFDGDVKDYAAIL